MSSERSADRALAAAIGLLLGLVSPIAVLAAWQSAYLEGTEACTRCGMEREVNELGPIRIESVGRPVRRQPYEYAPPDCPGHDWVRTGCWTERGGTFCYAPAFGPR